MPEVLMQINNVKNKKQKLLFLYNNPAFKTSKPSYQTDQEYLTELINKYRLNVN